MFDQSQRRRHWMELQELFPQLQPNHIKQNYCMHQTAPFTFNPFSHTHARMHKHLSKNISKSSVLLSKDMIAPLKWVHHLQCWCTHPHKHTLLTPVDVFIPVWKSATDGQTLLSWWNSHQKVISTSRIRANYGLYNYCFFSAIKKTDEIKQKVTNQGLNMQTRNNE